MNKSSVNNSLPPVLLLGLFYGGLSIARSLGPRDIKIYGFDFTMNQITGESKYCHVLNWDIEEKYDDSLVDKLIQFSKDIKCKIVVFLLNDEWVLFFSRNRRKLSKYYYFNLPKEDLIETLLSKNNFANYLTECDKFFFPKTYLLCKENHEMIENTLSFPCILKFSYQSSWKGFLSFSDYYKIKIVNHKDQFHYWYHKFISYGELIAQEFIPGPPTSLYYLTAYCPADCTNPIIFIGNKLRLWPANYGGETYLQSVRNRDVEEIGFNLLRDCGYKGPVGLDIKYDERDHKYKIIEVNTRFGSSDGLAVSAGIDFPYLYYRDIIGKSIDSINKYYEEGRKWIRLDKDIESYAQQNNMNFLSFWEWLKSILPHKSLTYESFDISDIKPFLYECKKIVKLFTTKLCSSIPSVHGNYNK